MGTWSAKIFGNDTSCEVKEYFYSEYNSGKEPIDIEEDIYSKFDSLISCEDTQNDVWFALTYCLWETKSLSDSLLDRVKAIVDSKADLKILESLDATDDFLKERDKELQKFIKKISVERPTAKRRQKLPIPIKSDIETGSCLIFRYPNGKYGGLVVIDAEFYRNKGEMRYAITNIYQSKAPDYDTFLQSNLIEFNWEDVFGQSMRYVAFDDKTGRITTYSLGYDKETKKSFFEYNTNFFWVVGKLPKFTQCLLTTIGTKTLYRESYEDFERLLSQNIYYDKSNSIKPVSKENLLKLSEILHKRK